MHRLALIFLCFCLAVGVGSGHAQTPEVSTSGIASVRAEKIHIPGVPSNAGKVSDQLYRGAQSHLQSIAQLKEIGITTIVDLRAENAGMRDLEKNEAESLGIRFVSIPVGGWSNPTMNAPLRGAPLTSLPAREATRVPPLREKKEE